MAPPSQAGKFKPRKPAKKIRVGEATGSAAAASHQQQTAREKAAAAAASSGRGGRGSGRGGGRGGGGRGGSTGRTPAPQGQVFFTGTAPDTVTSGSGRSGGSSSAGGSKGTGTAKKTVGNSSSKPSSSTTTTKQTGSKDIGKKDSSQEEIVGVLEEGIGSSAKPDKVGGSGKSGRGRADSSSAGGDDHDDGSSDKNGTKGSLKTKSGAQVEGYYYDSDSSSDEEGGDDGDGAFAAATSDAGRRNHQQQQQNKQMNLQPVELPYPSTKKLPPATAITAEQQPSNVLSLSVSDDEMAINETTTSALLLASTQSTQQQQQQQQQTSSGINNNNDWFLVQLPTRLPPLQKKEGTSDDGQQQQGSSSSSLPGTAAAASDHVQVNINPLQTDRFDNALAQSIPGRIGKLVVYKSGKTILLLEGPDGSPTIRMDVTEHGCAFKQQAVVIDKDEGQLVMLGDVQNTIIATPDLSIVSDFS